MIIKIPTQIGNPVIRRRSKTVRKITSKETKKIVRDLIDSMRHHQLVGMAAPQIGINLRIFVTEIRKTKLRKNRSEDALRIFINPTITSASKKKILGYEGCGSVAYAQLFGKVSRSEEIKVKARDENGKLFLLKSSGLLARVIQHEVDHLNGMVYLDRMNDTKTLMSRHEYLNGFNK